MNTSEKIKNELKSLLDERRNLFELTKNKKNCGEFGTAYQAWYSRAYKVVELLGSVYILKVLTFGIGFRIL